MLQSQQASEHLLVTARKVVALARPGRFGRARRDDRTAVDDAMERLEVADIAKRHLADIGRTASAGVHRAGLRFLDLGDDLHAVDDGAHH